MKGKIKIIFSIMVITLFAIPAVNVSSILYSGGSERDVECHLTGATNI